MIYVLTKGRSGRLAFAGAWGGSTGESGNAKMNCNRTTKRTAAKANFCYSDSITLQGTSNAIFSLPTIVIAWHFPSFMYLPRHLPNLRADLALQSIFDSSIFGLNDLVITSTFFMWWSAPLSNVT